MSADFFTFRLPPDKDPAGMLLYKHMSKLSASACKTSVWFRTLETGPDVYRRTILPTIKDSAEPSSSALSRWIPREEIPHSDDNIHFMFNLNSLPLYNTFIFYIFNIFNCKRWNSNGFQQ
jgi:hypothetical protein